MRVETTAKVSANRKSVRITTTDTYTGALVVLDAVHMPTGCATWPAFWSNGPNWPVGGEIDIVEGVNTNSDNQATIHTSHGCTIPSSNPSTLGITGTVVGGTNCAAAETGNAGCGMVATQSNTYGVGFNNNGGGVYAMQWVDSGISVWFFPRSSIPSDLSSGAPVPDGWGTPMAHWPSSGCDPSTFFSKHSAIFDTTLCGDWAGNVWESGGCAASTGVSTCQQYVQDNGSAFNDAYWEVERAAKLLREVAVSKTIVDVETVEDTIVFSSVSHTEFATALKGRTVEDAQRYGKVFYLTLSGEGRHPVMHFGMTGMLQVKGQLATYYRETPRKASVDWPPRFMKFILHLKGPTDAETTQVAFLDARRLGRIRLCASPLTEPPISALGFDPILGMPSAHDFKKGVRKRSCPVKALLLDQSFSAGVGNWVADEILYHARVHPEERCNALSDEQLAALFKQTSEVCRIAVSVNADDSKFPDDWLFKHRWGKGKKEKHTLKLSDGEPATIKWITVGGRTSAYVAELQKLQRGGAKSWSASNMPEDEADESDLTPLSGDEEEKVVKKVTRKRKRKSDSEERPRVIVQY
ncbi:hypothetical protein TRAPUB_10248 [Trametes pubescens]|uniref:Uncharacterized protein n=1 Tax=Trametes pubescens TaxID=154538 RepID=A0A1M2W032_TRAPU|nr:hypothetical protein TRAPUB_10248 [Trametes pubescens]